MKLLVVAAAGVVPLIWGWWLARRDERRLRGPDLVITITFDASAAITAMRALGEAIDRFGRP